MWRTQAHCETTQNTLSSRDQCTGHQRKPGIPRVQLASLFKRKAKKVTQIFTFYTWTFGIINCSFYIISRYSLGKEGKMTREIIWKGDTIISLWLLDISHTHNYTQDMSSSQREKQTLEGNPCNLEHMRITTLAVISTPALPLPFPKELPSMRKSQTQRGGINTFWG